MMRCLTKKSAFWVGVTLLTAIPMPAFTQSMIEEVIITARKQSETLQEIPDSVTVIDAEQINDARITNIKGFAAITPNLNVSTNFRAGLSFVTIRGLITPQVGEAPLAFVVDGVTVPNLEFINQGLHQIERIEVLRGPQGALYGKNAIGGAVNIITQRPSNELQGTVEASIAEGKDFRASGAVSGPIIEDKLYFRLAANYRDFDGLIDNEYLNEKADYVDDAYGLQAALLFEFNDRSTLDLRARHSDVSQGTNYMSFINPAQIEDFSIPPLQNAVGIDEQKLSSFTGKYDYEADAGTFTLIAGYNKSEDNQFSDADFTPLPPTDANFFFPSTQVNKIEDESINIEARFGSDVSDKFRWLIGAFYEDRNRIVQFDQIFDFPGTTRVTREDALPLLVSYADCAPDDLFIGCFPTEGERTNQDAKAFAVFGQFNYDLTDTLELTGAIRYDEEKRDAIDERSIFTEDSRISATFNEVQPKVSLAWSATDNILLSLTYSRGFRSGGFNEYSPFVVRSYQPELSDTIELGAKTSWLDGRMTLNGAIFRIDQEDAQFTRFNSQTFTLENLNVQEVEIVGAELELMFHATDNLDLRLGAGLVDNEITRNQGIDPGTGLDLAATVGNSMPYVADFNLNGSANYRIPLDNGNEVKALVSFSTLGPRTFDIYGNLTGESNTHTSINANIAYNSENWSVSVFGSNLTDARTPETVFFFNPLIRFPNVPRQVGVQFRYIY